MLANCTLQMEPKASELCSTEYQSVIIREALSDFINHNDPYAASEVFFEIHSKLIMSLGRCTCSGALTVEYSGWLVREDCTLTNLCTSVWTRFLKQCLEFKCSSMHTAGEYVTPTIQL